MRVNRPRYGALLCGLVLASCASTSRVQRQVQPDGSYRLDCQVALTQCLVAVEEVCQQGYELVQAHQDVRVAGPRELTEPTVTSEAIARCRTDPPVFGGQPKAAPIPPAPGEPTGGAPASASTACFPGATQACVGPGACKGGQQCLANGTAFGACDCGGAGAPPPPPPVAPAVEIPAPR